MLQRPANVAELRADGWDRDGRADRTVRDELRANLLARLRRSQPLFPGVVGYDDTVLPALTNALLSRHNFILLGLRGQAKSRIMRGLVELLDEVVPAVAGCEIHDHPFRPICAGCRRRLADEGDATPIVWLERDRRFVEKLATPDVTVADLIGDLDPIRAAKSGLALSDELTIHYGLLPRANRGVFGMNELPDLAGKVQVSLFNIMQEGDVQIKGYPVRLPLDVLLVFTANPEDYTARGKIITPLKDRIGSEIRTHYPATLEIGMKITSEQAWTERTETAVEIPDYVREVVERIAFVARDDGRIDKRSGVSQRLPISVLENVVSSAERRAAVGADVVARPRVSDVYAALPAVTGKIELEYEGELKGAERVAREVVRGAVASAFERRFDESESEPVVAWFDAGGLLSLDEHGSDASRLQQLESITGLIDLARKLEPNGGASAVAAAAEFVLEGLYGKQRISRSEERMYMKAEPDLHERSLANPGFRPSSGGFDDDLLQ